jgi:hypothetical protein
MIYEPEEAQIILMSTFFRELRRGNAYALEKKRLCNQPNEKTNLTKGDKEC